MCSLIKTMSSLAPEHLEKMRTQIRGWIASEGGSVTPGSVFKLVTTCMKCAEEIVQEKGKGSYKKDLVITAIEIALEETHNDDEAVLRVLRTVVPVAMDAMVDLSRGRLGPFKVPDAVCDAVEDVVDDVKNKCWCIPFI